MCIVYNQIGCLTDIKSHLNEHDVNRFNTLEEIIDFQKGYSTIGPHIVNQAENVTI